MKTMKCYDCDIEFKSADHDDILNQMYAHYMKDHPTIIPNASEEGKKAWMEEFEKDWKVAPEVAG